MPLEQPAAIRGVRLSTATAGIRKTGKLDLCVFEICRGASVAGVFTRNIFCAAPVTLAREHLAAARARLLVINSGNANAGTGEAGIQDARDVCEAAGALVGCSASEVLPFSTGVIGQRLPAAKIIAALPKAIHDLGDFSWDAAARAIMTTDTVPKCFSVEVKCDSRTYSVTGIAKGAGMIKPNMATMLAFIATDAAIPQADLSNLLESTVNRTFNRITIDGDTSTNDSCILIATGQSDPNELVCKKHPDWNDLSAAIVDVANKLARAIVRDGEGATKLVTVDVRGGRTLEDCLKAAFTVAESPLVKTALFASDPNWGRILAALGRSGVEGLKMSDLAISLNDCPIVKGGEPVADYDESLAAKIMAQPEFDIRIDIGHCATQASVLTCDFSFEYVRINAEYRS
ncbi:MAG: bifunctional glutamate N-acetyltransferase/amino-acid acetyltransferase ArgJ [Gammaproteobacteria bacterium]|nr:bifunctional glutamate N-acetyltransferase/amino-acid acetyltransferase ArgJ [Gammaproteobacteria bacterium]